jgi:hypothetical protein
VAANETAASFTYENNQPLAAIVANAVVGLYAQKSISGRKRHSRHLAQGDMSRCGR